MAETRILSGKMVSDAVYTALENRIQSLKESSVVPGLAAVIVEKIQHRRYMYVIRPVNSPNCSSILKQSNYPMKQRRRIFSIG